MLAAAIMLASDNDKVTEQIVHDAYGKAQEESKKEEVKNEDGGVVGKAATNVKIIQTFFEYQEPKEDGADLSLNSEAITLLKLLMKKVDAAAEKEEKINKIAKVAASIAEPKEKVELRSMPGDGKCLYWVLVAIEAMVRGKKVSDIKYDEPLLSEVKAQIMEHGMAIREIMENQGKNVEEEWFKLVGEPINQFYSKVTDRRKLGQVERHGGHVEASIST